MEHILTILIFFPAICALFGAGICEKNIKIYAILVAMIEFIISCAVIFLYQKGAVISYKAEILHFLGIYYHVKIDEISMFLVLLSALISLISLFIAQCKKDLIICILCLQSAMIGVFVSFDAILFYIFWEISIVPLVYLIARFGSGAKIYAAVKFFIYTFFGSVLMLVGIVFMGFLHFKMVGVFSFDIEDWQNLSLPFNHQIWLFLAFFMAFAVKIPLFPFHTWLPYAHGQAPTIGSVLLAAILLKMGAYGFVRFSLPIFPDASVYFSKFVCILAVIMVIYTAFVAFAQKDMKQVIAYSSISHMGIIVLGIFAMNTQGLSGALFFMISHAIVSSGLFVLVGAIYERRGTKIIAEFGAIANIMPFYTAFFAIFMLGAIGLPLTSGFVGEFLSLLAIFKANAVFAILGAIGMILGAIYMLNLFRNVFFGTSNRVENLSLKDLNFKEFSALLPLALLVLALGIYPNIILKNISQGSENTIKIMYQNASKQETKLYLQKSNLIKRTKLENN